MGEPHLLVDARPLAHPTAAGRGIGNYTLGLLGGLVASGTSCVALVASAENAVALDGVVPPDAIRVLRRDTVRQLVTSDSWYVATGLFLHPVSFDPIPAMITEAGVPVAGVMYDVIPYRYPEQYLTDENAARQAQLRAPLARTVDLTAAISRFAADTAVAELGLDPRAVCVIGAGVSPAFVPGGPHVPRTATVVAVTGPDERKNTDGLIRAWALVDPGLRTCFRLVIVSGGPAAVLARWRDVIRSSGVGDSVELTGAVTDAQMIELLQRATLVVQPSFEEGFGLPVVEAAACGAPIITSDSSSLPEVLAEPSATFDPQDPASIAGAIERGLRDDGHRAVLLAASARAAARWRWERVGRDLTDAMSAVPSRTARQHPIRERVAVVSTPGDDAIGDLLADVIADDPTADVVVLLDPSATTEPIGGRAPGVRPAAGLGRMVPYHEFDHVLTIVDDTTGAAVASRIARRFATHVWFRTTVPTGPEAAWARSIIVASAQDGARARQVAGGAVPILVLGEPIGDRSRADLGRTLLDWMRVGCRAGVPVTIAGAADTLS